MMDLLRAKRGMKSTVLNHHLKHRSNGSNTKRLAKPRFLSSSMRVPNSSEKSPYTQIESVERFDFAIISAKTRDGHNDVCC